MGEVIDFPVKTRAAQDTAEDLKQDPYYRFLHTVLSTANESGFQLPFNVESATEHVYQQTRHKSEIARILAKKKPQT